MDFFFTLIKTYVPEISLETFASFKNIICEKKYAKNDIIVNKGEIPKKFYILKKGIIKSSITDNKGKEHIKTLYIPISTSGALSSLIKNTPSDTTYECLTDCNIIEGNYLKFMELTQKNHELAILYYKILERVFLRTENKLSDLTVLNATERYLKLKKNIPNISNLISQYHIASYLNITPVQLSRIRKKIYSK